MASSARTWDKLLAEEFNLDEQTMSHLIRPFPEGIGVASHDDFVNIFCSEAEIGEIVKTFDRVPNKLLATTRLRKAWTSTRAAMAAKSIMAKSPAEENDVLPSAELESLQTVFHKRYKLSWPADIEPSDLLVSRITREIDKRSMSLISLDSVRTLAHHQQSSRKKISLGGDVNLMLEEHSTDQSATTTNVSGILAALFTLLVAYARAGAKPREGITKEETRSDPSTMFVEAPLDVLLRYHSRAAKAAAMYRGPDLAAWLRTTDLEERRKWIEEMRTSKATLGEVVQKVYNNREIFWSPPTAATSQPPKEGSPTKRQKAETKSQAMGTSEALYLRTGDDICSAYNSKKGCQGSCGKQHVCSRVSRNGRLCMQSHSSLECRNHRPS